VHLLALRFLLLSAGLPLAAQAPRPAPVTLWAGHGTAFAGLGLGAELRPGQLPVSGFAAAGYMPAGDIGRAGDLSASAGLRLHAALGRVPAFLEVSYGALARDMVAAPQRPGGVRRTTLAGLGTQVGLQAPARGPWAVMGSIGVGYATTAEVAASRWKVTGSIGVGYRLGGRRGRGC
jgi:hypothetical protein